MCATSRFLPLGDGAACRSSLSQGTVPDACRRATMRAQRGLQCVPGPGHTLAAFRTAPKLGFLEAAACPSVFFRPRPFVGKARGHKVSGLGPIRCTVPRGAQPNLDGSARISPLLAREDPRLPPAASSSTRTSQYTLDDQVSAHPHPTYFVERTPDALADPLSSARDSSFFFESRSQSAFISGSAASATTSMAPAQLGSPNEVPVLLRHRPGARRPGSG